MNTDGSSGRALGAAGTDSDGSFRIVPNTAPAGAIRLVVSGGSYASLANGAATATDVALTTVVPSVGSAGVRGLAITPLTTFADRRVTTLMAGAVPLPSALAQAEAEIRRVYGIQGSSLPLYSLLPDFSLASGDAGILALLFGVFDELAALQGRTPAEIFRALGEDWADGRMDGRTTGGAAISFGTGVAPATLSTADFLSAMNVYLSPSNTGTIAARNGVTFDATTVTTVQLGVVTQVQASWTQGSNNSALLAGAAVGTGVDAVSQLRKPLGVSVVGANASVVFGSAYATRSGTTSDAVYVVLPLTNVGNEALCFVNLTGLTYRNAAGAALRANGLTYAQGSVRTMTASSIDTDTCLAPGETGMVSDIHTDVGYSAVASMEFSVGATVGGSAPTLASIVPQGYAVQPVSFYQSLAVTLENVGTGPGRLGNLNHRWVLFDDSMVPLHWGFANDVITPQVPLAVGATGSISDATLIYSGAGRNLLVFVDFDDGTGTGAASAASCRGPTRESRDACAQQARTRRLSAQHAAALESSSRAASASGAGLR